MRVIIRDSFRNMNICSNRKTPPKFGSFTENPYICRQKLEYYDYGNIGTR